eukprot:scaffold180_cov311-Pinguiococcus_pyrenoidosus.AAC.41
MRQCALLVATLISVLPFGAAFRTCPLRRSSGRRSALGISTEHGRYTLPDTDRYKAISVTSLRHLANTTYPQLFPKLADIEMAARVFPFKASPFVLDRLIDWENIDTDPIFRMLFPTMQMLSARHRRLLEGACQSQDQLRISEVVQRIRAELNPHPAGQKELNTGKAGMEALTGVQHMYDETILFFPAAGQTCHAYCT